jgi:hypothetical protein
MTRDILRGAANVCALIVIAGSSCAPAEAGKQLVVQPDAADLAAGAGAAGIVDSIFPIWEEVRRFRAVLGPEPPGLSGGARSRDALVDRFVAAVIAADTSAFAEMLLSRDEFGWLYYPYTRFTSPPYELPPALVWFQIENGSSSGLGRLLRRVAGRPLNAFGHHCPTEPLVEGPNRLWEGCTVRVDPPNGDRADAHYFGTIIERGGVFKFVSYTNDF